MNYENRLIKSEWIVKPISISTARILIEKYHYAKSATNTGVYTFGLFKIGNDFFENQCLGCSWWLPPTKNAAIATFDGEWQKVLSLTRLVVAPNVPKNACSFLLSKSIKMIDKTKWHCLVTYADTCQNHSGTIYKANNWEYMGLTTASAVFQSNKGKIMGRKRGGKNLTIQELNDIGFNEIGKFQKHKFRMILTTSN